MPDVFFCHGEQGREQSRPIPINPADVQANSILLLNPAIIRQTVDMMHIKLKHGINTDCYNYAAGNIPTNPATIRPI